jgi:hypothetical protein
VATPTFSPVALAAVVDAAVLADLADPEVRAAGDAAAVADSAVLVVGVAAGAGDVDLPRQTAADSSATVSIVDEVSNGV